MHVLSREKGQGHTRTLSDDNYKLEHQFQYDQVKA